jgi:nucleoside 2-deoxyribosyltransferase
MKSIAFCGSVKHIKDIQSWAEYLIENNVETFLPKGDYEQVWSGGDEEKKRELSYKLLTNYFKIIGKVDVVFIFNPEGRIGNSTTLELGVAHSSGKEIFALNRDNSEMARDVLIQKTIATKEELLKELSR